MSISHKTKTQKIDNEAVFKQIKTLLIKHLGSHAAAELWLITSSPEFINTPLETIHTGNAKLVLAMLQSQYGPNPTY